MQITLSNVRLHPDMSEETDCFSATILLDGNEVGTVKNDGQGGSHRYHWQDRATGTRIKQWSETQVTEFDFERLDQIIDDLIAKHEEQKQLRQWCQRETLFRLKGDKKDLWRAVKTPFDPKVKAILIQKYGESLERIANEEL